MKIRRKQAILSVSMLSLFLLVVACQYQDTGPLVPNRYSTLRDLKFPDSQVTAPASVSITASTITVPTQANLVNTAIATISAVNQTPAAITQAVTDVNSALTNTGVTVSGLTADFTPQVIATLTSQGILPGTTQAKVAAISSTQALQPYLTTYSLPKINGQDISSTTTAIKLPDLINSLTQPLSVSAVISATRNKPFGYVGNDVTFNEANEVFAATVKRLEATRLDQISLINAVYADAKKTADADLPSCQTTNTSKYNSLISAALQGLNTNIGYLNSGKNRLGDVAYNTLVALLYVQYTKQVQSYYQLQTADANACKISSDAKIRYATVYRDTNLNTLNNTFNTTVQMAQSLLRQIYDESTENQGSGQ